MFAIQTFRQQHEYSYTECNSLRSRVGRDRRECERVDGWMGETEWEREEEIEKYYILTQLCLNLLHAASRWF